MTQVNGNICEFLGTGKSCEVPSRQRLCHDLKVFYIRLTFGLNLCNLFIHVQYTRTEMDRLANATV